MPKRLIYSQVRYHYANAPDANDGTRTHTSTSLSRMSLPLDYAGFGADGGTRTLTNLFLKQMPLPLGYVSFRTIGVTGLEPVTLRSQGANATTTPHAVTGGERSRTL